MSEIETYAIRELTDCYGTKTNAQALVYRQSQSVVDKARYMDEQYSIDNPQPQTDQQ